MNAGVWTVTAAWFPANTIIAQHTHDHASFATMLSGSFETKASHRRFHCTPGKTWTEPMGARHANVVQSRDAHVVIVHAPEIWPDDLHSFATLFDGRHVFAQGVVVCEANRLCCELAHPDRYAAVAAESLIMEMVTAVLRTRGTMKVARDAKWLCDAEALLRARFRDPITLGEIATTLGVERSILAHAFRRRFRRTTGEYLRLLRLDWALEQIATTPLSLAEVALAAGFADQSHLTRVCTRSIGMPPRAFRQASTQVQRAQRALAWQSRLDSGSNRSGT